MKSTPIHFEKNTLASFFIISLTMLLFELLISRVMSAVAHYHFAFMAICLALFGITLGAVFVHKFKNQISNNYTKTFYLSSIFFSITVFINLVAISQLRAFTLTNEWLMIPNRWNLIILFATIAIPFIACGICMALTFERYAKLASRLYFVNLLGASLGCLLFIPVINLLGMTNSYFLLIFLGLLAALFVKTDNNKFIAVSILALILSLMGILSLTQKSNPLDLKWVKGSANNRHFFKEWNSYSYVRLYFEGPAVIPKGWSFGPKKFDELTHTKVGQIHLTIDGGAGTAMTNFQNRDLSTIKFLGYDITSLPYHLVKNGDVLVIGLGAGRDVLTGLLFNQHSITGVEINKTILKIHRTFASKFTGDLSHHPKVTFINNEARSYINASERKFDIIQISLIDTFAATQAGAYALSENNLYTTEAIETYWNHLTDNGMISISYWTFPYMLKIIGSATQTLDKYGIKNPKSHFILIHSDIPAITTGVGNLLIKKTPFTTEEIKAVGKYCDEMGFHFALSTYGSPYVELTNVSDMRFLKNYVKNYDMNITPATDDNPFFFITTRLNILKSLREFKIFDINNADQILVSLLAIMIILTFLFVVLPLAGMTKKPLTDIPVFSFGIYFTAIGLGFMFIEMTQITRLSSFLGHPTYSLALALFTFLLGSGIGSFYLGSVDNKQTMMRYTAFFIAFCILSGIYTSPFLHYCSKFPIELRMLLAVIILFPLAFFMGTFLPQGMKLLSRKNAPVALFWGLNGAASVLGSILAMIVQIQFGLSMTFYIGIGLYVLAIALLFHLERKCV